jgi:hypothetical protein
LPLLLAVKIIVAGDEHVAAIMDVTPERLHVQQAVPPLPLKGA